MTIIQKHIFSCSLLLFACLSSKAQYTWQYDGEAGKMDILSGATYKAEAQASVSDDTTPLWLNANKHGLSSLESKNGYMRMAVERPLQTDSAHRWGIGYGADVAVAANYSSRVLVQQAYAELRWLHGLITVGSKYHDLELKNSQLSSGSQTLGINARPVPEVRLSLPEYWTLPIFNRWVHLKGHVAYGRYTDSGWQQEFTAGRGKYTTGALHHSKAGYLKIGNDDQFVPWSLEMGLEMAAQWGGTSHVFTGEKYVESRGEAGIKGAWHAFVPGGADASDGMYENAAGNTLGSWVARFNYDTDRWTAHIYADHFFEDHSQMFFLDYNGYGEAEAWNVKKDRKFYLYKLKDMMLGFELNLKQGTWLRNIVVEYMYTKYQSGPFNHDRTYNIPDHMAGQDDYYNHGFYSSWSHWGQVMGNPLYRSPIYNTSNSLTVENNRFVAYHVGIDGKLAKNMTYRLLATHQNGWGTYLNPYTKKKRMTSVMLETAYALPHSWNIKAAYGMDFGDIIGNNRGAQLTITKTGLLKK